MIESHNISLSVTRWVRVHIPIRTWKWLFSDVQGVVAGAASGEPWLSHTDWNSGVQQGVMCDWQATLRHTYKHHQCLFTFLWSQFTIKQWFTMCIACLNVYSEYSVCIYVLCLFQLMIDDISSPWKTVSYSHVLANAFEKLCLPLFQIPCERSWN